MKATVDCVVTNYRTPGDLARFLHSYVEVAGEVDAHLSIMNVHPNDADVEVARDFIRSSAACHDATHVLTPANIGYGRSCNLAATHGHGSVLAFFNADTELRPGVLEECASALLAVPAWGVLGPRQVNDRNQLTHAGLFASEGGQWERGWKEPDSGQYSDVVDTAYSVAGSAYFIKRTVWDELTACPIFQRNTPALGAFLPTQHYFEETWCSVHARAHGAKVVYYGLATMIHNWHRASRIGEAEIHTPASKAMFDDACRFHNIQP